MAEGTSNFSNNQNPTSSNLNEFREMFNVALNSNVSNQMNRTLDEQTINDAVLALEDCDDNQLIDEINPPTNVSIAEVPSAITESLNDAVKQLSLLYGSVISTTTENGEQINDSLIGENHDASIKLRPQGLNDDEDEDEKEESRDQFSNSSTIPKTTSQLPTNQTKKRKRHIMISYNRSSRETCQKIYTHLVERNYKVWMDLTDMGDNILASMAQAVENSYIVLLCINQSYYESGYCRLEAEYAAENRIKFIPCLMEKSFRAESWLGIIKGSNYHIDFSSPEDFDESFEELVRQITLVEERLSLCPRRTPAPDPMINPMRFATVPQTPPVISTLTNDVNSRRFDTIIREYKRSIKKKRQHLNQLKSNELSDLIVKLRQELFNETSQILSDGERSDEEDEKQNQDQILQQLLNRSLDQNDLLLRLVDRLTTPPPMQQNNSHNINMDGFFKVIIAIMLLWALNIICQKN